MVIEGVKTQLTAADRVEVAGTVYDAFSALAFLKTNRADVVLLDINLPDLSGIDLCQKLKAEFPALKILAMSTFKERSYITRMIEQGASVYMLKSVIADKLFVSLLTVDSHRKNFLAKLGLKTRPLWFA